MFSHIIIVVQENRTPDNLFGAHAPNSPCGTLGDFPGADIVSTGVGNGTNNCNAVYPLIAGFDPNHQNADWVKDYDGGNMDGFCDGGSAPCQPYSFVRSPDVAAYFAIATTYGFANYMFQTNQGPSLEAHQFLFTGTSAPVAVNGSNDYYWYFVKDNPASATSSGCPINTDLTWIDPLGHTYANPPLNSECYAHDSLVTGATYCNSQTGICDKSATWRYYTPSAGSIWDAPDAIPEVCYGINDATRGGNNIACGTTNSINNGAEWNAHMRISETLDSAPILTDIANCQLQQISWVIPDSAWSDHPESSGGLPLGPVWVSEIVNAVGQSYANSNGACDYWGTSGSQTSGVVQPTAILVVWDDWGGFYDHIPPFSIPQGSGTANNWGCNGPSEWGCGYAYGFRVPFLVVSEYTGTKSGSTYTGYISGACGSSCSNNKFPYQHDFGSILAFAEFNFGLPTIDPSGKNRDADYNAPDWGSLRNNTPLSDFFSLYPSNARPFVPISVNYPQSYFHNYYQNNNASPMGPDTD